MSGKYTWCGHTLAFHSLCQWKEAWWMADDTATDKAHTTNRAHHKGEVFTVFETLDGRLVLANEEAAAWPDISNESEAVIAGPFETLDAAKVAYELLKD